MRIFLVLVVMMLAGVSQALAQSQTGPNDACRGWDVLPNVTVTTSAVTVLAADPKLCGVIIMNRSNADVMRCRGIAAGDPTSTLGIPVDPGGVLTLDLQAQRGVKCVRDTTAAADVPVVVTPLFP